MDKPFLHQSSLMQLFSFLIILAMSNYFTAIPILRAVPATIRIADSTVKQLRSTILSSAIV